MTGPGGREVARVSVRAVPDTSGFAADLRRDLERFERSLRIEIPVDLDLSGVDGDLRRVRAQAQAVPAQIRVEPEGMAAFRAKLAAQVAAAARTVTATVRVDVDGGGLGGRAGGRRGLFGAITRLADSVGRVVGRSVTAAVRVAGTALDSLSGLFSTTSRAGAALGNVIGGLASTVGGMAGKIGSAATVVASFAVKLAAVAAIAGVVASALGLLAGAILAVGGAVGAGVAGLPVLLTALVAPIAAVTIGMEGIKRAAQVLRPEMDALRTSLENTFQALFTPIFEQLRVVFPVLERGLTSVAVAVASFAGALVDVITSAQGLANIEAALMGVQDAVSAAIPGAQALLREVLAIAGTRPLYTILGETIGGLAQRFADFLARVREAGLLESALAGLRDVLFAVTDAFLKLFEGAIRFFDRAAPGLAGFFDGLSAAFGKIDWAALGESFGRIFQAIGDGIAAVPPETWQRLADATAYFADAVERFMASGALEGLIVGFGWLVRVGGALIDVITGLSAPFRWIGESLGLIKGQADVATEGLKGTNDQMGQMPLKAQEATERTPGFFSRMVSSIGGFLADLPDTVGFAFGYAATTMIQSAFQATATVVRFFRELGPKLGSAASTAANAVINWFRRLDETLPRLARSAVDGVVRFLLSIPDRLRGLRDRLRQLGRDLIMGLINGIKQMAQRVAQAAIEVVTGAIRGARAALSSHSPSRAAQALGVDFGRGLELGILATLSRVVAAVRAMISRALAQVDPSVWHAAGRDLLGELTRGATEGQASLRRATTGLIQAEDGSWVPPSFYGRTEGSDVASALAGMEFVIDSRGGEVITKLVNRVNALNAARA